MVAAVLKYGDYRSAAQYLNLYRTEAERNGYTVDAPGHRALKDFKRSCERGLGPAVQSMGLPFERLEELPAGRKPWAPDGPLSPRNVLVAGS